MTELRPREAVVLATDFPAMVTWYHDVLGFEVTQLFEGDFHYGNLETKSGIKLGIGVASEVGVTPHERRSNTVVLQFEVDDVRAFFRHVEEKGGKVLEGPTRNEADGFWFGSFADPEGNPFWVVDGNCP